MFCFRYLKTWRYDLVDSVVIDTLHCRWRRTRAARASTMGRGRERARARSPPRWPGAGGRSWSCSALSSSSSSPVSCPSRYLDIYLAFLFQITKIFVIYNIYIIYGFSNGTNELKIISMLCMQVLTMWVVISPYEIFDHIDLELYFNILYFCRLMFYINSAINPILYNTMSSRCQNHERSSFCNVMTFLPQVSGQIPASVRMREISV